MPYLLEVTSFRIRQGYPWRCENSETRFRNGRYQTTRKCYLERYCFDIISLNDNSVLVEGKLYKKNEVVKTIRTDIEGIASTSADLLPYGTSVSLRAKHQTDI